MLRYASIWDRGIQIDVYLRLDQHWYSYFGLYSYLCLSSTVRVDWSESNQIVIGVMQRKHWYSCSETSLQSEPAYNFSLTYILGRMKTLVIRSNWMYLGKSIQWYGQQILPCLLIVAKVPFPGKMAGKGKMCKRMEALACPHCPGSDSMEGKDKMWRRMETMACPRSDSDQNLNPLPLAQ